MKLDAYSSRRGWLLRNWQSTYMLSWSNGSVWVSGDGMYRSIIIYSSIQQNQNEKTQRARNTPNNHDTNFTSAVRRITHPNAFPNFVSSSSSAMHDSKADLSMSINRGISDISHATGTVADSLLVHSSFPPFIWHINSTWQMIIWQI